jgi:excisionase family DNA binding protein
MPRTRRPPRERRRILLRRVFPEPPTRPAMLEARLLRAGEVAALLQVSRRSVSAWARRGLLAYIETPGGHRRFRAADVRALVASLRTHPGPAGDPAGRSGREPPAQQSK